MHIAMDASRPSSARNAVVLCVDENYFPFACFVADQVARKANTIEVDIVICAPRGCQVPRGLTNVRLCYLETGDLFKGLYLDERRTENVYHSLVVADAMQNDYDRILYVDADIFFHGGDLKALFDIDMRNLAVAAVRDSCQWIKPNTQPAVFKSLGIGPKKYLNSGVMLIDVRSFVTQGILDKCVDYGRTIQHAQRQHDQELINGVLQGDWVELSPIWNWQHPIRSAYYEVMLPVAITHFIGPHKPWRDPHGLVPPRYPLAFAAFLARYFPDMSKIVLPRGSEVSSAHIRKLTLKNLIRSRPLKRYLRRFPTDMLAVEP